MKLGAIEAGGTKFVLAIGNENGEVEKTITIPTTTPQETMPKVIQFFQDEQIEKLGVGSFGPVDVNEKQNTYGHILNTPKIAWQNYPFLQAMQEALQIPTGFSTDVNIAALGEYTYGAAKDVDSCLYVTIGTGIGAGAVMGGQLLKGLSHPEMGHTYVRRHPDDSFAGFCPFHHDCLEGLAAGPAIEKRWGKKGVELTDDQAVWDLEGYYIAQALVQYIMILMPEKIILGGGVAKQPAIYPVIHKHVKELLNGYLAQDVFTTGLDDYIVPQGLPEQSGIIGGLVLAKQAK